MTPSTESESRQHLVIDEDTVREIEVDDRCDDDDGEPYATPPNK